MKQLSSLALSPEEIDAVEKFLYYGAQIQFPTRGTANWKDLVHASPVAYDDSVLDTAIKSYKKRYREDEDSAEEDSITTIHPAIQTYDGVGNKIEFSAKEVYNILRVAKKARTAAKEAKEVERIQREAKRKMDAVMQKHMTPEEEKAAAVAEYNKAMGLPAGTPYGGVAVVTPVAPTTEKPTQQ